MTNFGHLFVVLIMSCKIRLYCNARNAFVHKMSRPRRVRAFSFSFVEKTS